MQLEDHKDIFETKYNRGNPVVLTDILDKSVIDDYNNKKFYLIIPLILYECAQCSKTKYIGTPYLVCSKCRAVYYCSGYCQNLHWSQHKKHCTEENRLLSDILNSLIYFIMRDNNMNFLKQLHDILLEIPVTELEYFLFSRYLQYELHFNKDITNFSQRFLNNCNYSTKIFYNKRIVHSIGTPILPIKITIDKSVTRTLILCYLTKNKKINRYSDHLCLVLSLLMIILAIVCLIIVIIINFLYEPIPLSTIIINIFCSILLIVILYFISFVDKHKLSFLPIYGITNRK